jgi:hypothetical protein
MADEDLTQSLEDAIIDPNITNEDFIKMIKDRWYLFDNGDEEYDLT